MGEAEDIWDVAAEGFFILLLLLAAEICLPSSLLNFFKGSLTLAAAEDCILQRSLAKDPEAQSQFPRQNSSYCLPFTPESHSCLFHPHSAISKLRLLSTEVTQMSLQR